MSDKKISQLPASATPLAGTETLAIVQSGDTKKTTVESVLTSVQLAGTANGVAFLNGSKVLTTSANLTFNGSSLNIVGGISTDGLTVDGAATVSGQIRLDNSNYWIDNSGGTDISYRSGGTHQFYSGGFNERLRIESGGNIKVNTGNIIIGTSGKGIDFSADGSAAGMTSELLDDYEEGTWTPQLRDGSSNTLNVGSGIYTKIGNRVFIQVIMNNINTTTLNAGDAVSVYGLPFSSAGGMVYTGSVFLDNVTFNDGCVPYIDTIYTWIQLKELRSGNSDTSITYSDLASGVADISISMSYIAA